MNDIEVTCGWCEDSFYVSEDEYRLTDPDFDWRCYECLHGSDDE